MTSINQRRTPSKVYDSILGALDTNPERINLVERDQELILSGWEIHFAFDPYDIGEFCFPFSRESALQTLNPSRVEQISRLQNGRYEAIYNVTHRPILLEAYERELEDLLDWAEWSKFVSKDSDVVDKYLEMLRIAPDGELDEIKEQLQKMTEDDISSVIAVVTGIVSIGFKNLSDLVRLKLVHGRPDTHPAQKAPALDYRPKVIDKILRTFQNYFDAGNKRVAEMRGRHASAALFYRPPQLIDANNRRDAKAFDQLLQLNQIYNKEKHLILYFSSSPKSLDLDMDEELKSFYPLINGEPYKLVRTATDLFVYMVYKGDSNKTKDRTFFARNRLKELGELITRVEQISDAFQEASSKCEYCKGNITAPLCKFGMLCNAVMECGEYIEKRQDSNVNYSLQKELAAVLEKTKRQAASDRHEAIRKIISDIIQTKGVVKAKDQEMKVGMQTALIKADFASAAVSHTGDEKDPKVSCYLNYYPVNLSIKNGGLKEVFDGVIGLLTYGWSPEAFDVHLGKYINLDTQLWHEEVESELIRSFLYLIMGMADKARQVAKKYLDDERQPGDIKREFRYMMCFILWNSNQYQKAIDMASEGIRLFPDDGRFYHCRSVITVSRLHKHPDQKDYSHKDLVDDTSRAIKRFSNNPRMLAVCYNNMAYYLSEQEFHLVDVPAAEDYLQKLTDLIPEAQWDPPYPEFFHTKGSVLYSKFLEGAPVSTLEEAYAAAKKALDMYRKREHEQLVNVISKVHRTYSAGSKPDPKRA